MVYRLLRSSRLDAPWYARVMLRIGSTACMYDDSGIRLDELAVVWDSGDQSCHDFFVEALLRYIMFNALAKTDAFVPGGVQEVAIYNSHDGPAFGPFKNTKNTFRSPVSALRSLSLSLQRSTSRVQLVSLAIRVRSCSCLAGLLQWRQPQPHMLASSTYLPKYSIKSQATSTTKCYPHCD